MKCKVIQDLLPLYAEALTSEESNALVKEHLEGCEECTRFYENMKEVPQEVPTGDRNISPMKKVKRSFIIRLTAGILASVVLLTTAFFFLFWGVIPIHSDKLNVQIALDTQNDKKTLEFLFTGDCGYIMERTDETITELAPGTAARHLEVTICPVFKLPFDDWGEHPNQFEWDLELPGENSMFKDVSITIHCQDKDITYDAFALAAMLEEAED